jgi:hypothetical protein
MQDFLDKKFPFYRCPSESVNPKTMLQMGKCPSTNEVVFARSRKMRILTT